MLHQVRQRSLKVLQVEGDEDRRGEVEDLLSHADDPRVDLEWCGYLSDALERLSGGGIDLVLLDLSLPDSEGVATFERMYAFAPDVPVAVLALEASEDDGELMISRLREHVRGFNESSSEPYRISVSMGTARFDPEDPTSLEELTEEARRAMKEEKMAKRPAVRP